MHTSRLCIVLSFFFFAVSSHLSSQSLSQESTVYFSTGSAVLDAENQAILGELVTLMNTYPDYSLQMEAHTDDRGGDDFNQALAERRAAAVRAYLAKQEMVTDGFRILSFGESQARYPNDTEDNRQRNRRVDIHLDLHNWQVEKDLSNALSASLWEKFTIDPQQDQTIEGAKGGRFLIPANSLVDQNGQVPTSPVFLKLVECYTLEDMLLMQLSTHAEDRVLETGGMVALRAETENGEILSLKINQSIAARIPTDNYRADMTIFYGDEVSRGADAPANWQNSGQAVKQNMQEFLRLAERPEYPVQGSLKYNGDWRAKLDKPEQPKEPFIYKARTPQLPSPDQVRFYPKGLQKLVMGKKAKAAKEAELYEAAVKDYKERLAIHQQRLANNEPKLIRHKAAMEAYQEQYEAWEARNDQKMTDFYESAKFNSWKQEKDSIFAIEIAKYRIDSANYEIYRERKIRRYEDALMQKDELSDSEINSYFFTIQKLGWVNCDVFGNYSSDQLAQLKVQDPAGDRGKTFLIMRDRPSLLQLKFTSEGIYTEAVPSGLAVDILSYKLVDGKIHLAQQDFTTGSSDRLELEYRPVHLRELREVMAGMGQD